MFAIELHHGGRFIKFLGISYIEGKLDHVDLVDIDEFFVHELDEVMLKLGYEVPLVIYYHYQLPNGDLEFGFRALGNDVDVLSLTQYIKHNMIIKLVDGSQSRRKKLCFNLEHNATFGDQDAQVEIGNQGATIGDQDTEVHEQGQFESEGVGERGGDGGNKRGSEGSEEDSDFLEDEENYVTDVEVDITDFYMNVDLDVEYVDKGKGVEDVNENVDIENIENAKVIDNDE
ncbi:unnamed protein product [Lactuca saligna]|uniref:PB1-like domain-containing protein n=1 Tax=Lactuca saligna TaxID=75948 RepID=A0AA35YUI3_LACSI|nr:unnamed protein product [Lactuca saligna]